MDVAVELIQAFKDRKKLITQLKSTQRKLTEKDEDIFGLLRESINRPINIQVGALAQSSTQTQQWIAPKPVKEISGLNKQKKELLSEIKDKFIPENCVGGLLLPSRVRDEKSILEVKSEIQEEIKEKKEKEEKKSEDSEENERDSE